MGCACAGRNPEYSCAVSPKSTRVHSTECKPKRPLLNPLCVSSPDFTLDRAITLYVVHWDSVAAGKTSPGRAGQGRKRRVWALSLGLLWLSQLSRCPQDLAPVSYQPAEKH